MLLYCYDEWYPYGFDGDCIGGTVMDNAAKVFFTFLGVVGVVAVAVALTKGLRGRRPGTNPGLGSQNTPGAGSFSFSEGSESELSSDENNRQDLGFDSLGLGVAPEPELNSDENNQQGSGFNSLNSSAGLGTGLNSDENDQQDSGFNSLNSSVGSNVDPTGEDDYTGGMPFLYEPMPNETKKVFEDLRKEQRKKQRKKHGKPKKENKKLPNLNPATDEKEEPLNPNPAANENEKLQSPSLVSGTFGNTKSPIGTGAAMLKYRFQIGRGDVEEIELSEGATVKDFENAVRERHGVEEDSEVSMIFAGKKLKDDRILEKFRFTEEDTVEVIISTPEDILLKTAKALRFPVKDGECEYEYEYEEDDNDGPKN